MLRQLKCHQAAALDKLYYPPLEIHLIKQGYETLCSVNRCCTRPMLIHFGAVNINCRWRLGITFQVLMLFLYGRFLVPQAWHLNLNSQFTITLIMATFVSVNWLG